MLMIPLLFGLVSDSSWQNALCNIEINGYVIFQCDELRDTLKIETGINTNLTVENDTLTLSSPALSVINSNDTYYSTMGGSWIASETNNELYIISDGSILIEFINYTGGIQ